MNNLDEIMSIRLSKEDIKKIDSIIQFWEEEQERYLNYSRSDVIRILIRSTYDHLKPKKRK